MTLKTIAKFMGRLSRGMFIAIFTVLIFPLRLLIKFIIWLRLLFIEGFWINLLAIILFPFHAVFRIFSGNNKGKNANYNTKNNSELNNLTYLQNSDSSGVFYAKYDLNIFIANITNKKWKLLDKWKNRSSYDYVSEKVHRKTCSFEIGLKDLKKNGIPSLNKKWASDEIKALEPTGYRYLKIEFLSDYEKYYQYESKPEEIYTEYFDYLFVISAKNPKWRIVDSRSKSDKFSKDLYANRTQTKHELLKNKIPLMKILWNKNIKKMKLPIVRSWDLEKIITSSRKRS